MKSLALAAALLAFSAAEAHGACDASHVWYGGECRQAGDPSVPAMYDFPFPGHKIINIAKDMDEMADFCSPHAQTGRVLGCTFRYEHSTTHDPRDTRCYIYIAPESYIRRQYRGLATPENVLRHELAHCNGWPGHHPH